MTQIIGISGKLGSGKSTAVNSLYSIEFNELGYKSRLNEKGQLLVVTNTDTMEEGILDISSKRPDVQNFLNETIHPFIKSYNLADPLKDFLIYILGLKYEQVYGTNDDKNTPTNIKWSQISGFFTKDYGPKLKKVEQELDVKYHPEGYITGRELLQVFGTDICRKMKPDCWTQFTLQRIQNEQPEVAVIPDIRFVDEVECIQKAGGRVIRLTRSIDQNTHASEKDLDNYKGFDAILDNATLSIPDQTTELLKILLAFGIYKQV